MNKVGNLLRKLQFQYLDIFLLWLLPVVLFYTQSLSPREDFKKINGLFFINYRVINTILNLILHSFNLFFFF